MEPASKIIRALGGAAQVSAITGVHKTRVYSWMKPREKGGTGGVIPFPHVPKLIAAADASGVELSANDFLPVVDGSHPPASVATPAADQGALAKRAGGAA